MNNVVNNISGCNEHPEFWRIITVSFSNDDIFSSVPMASENNRKDDIKYAKAYAENNDYTFVKIGECVSDNEMLERQKIDSNWYKYKTIQHYNQPQPK